MAFDAARYERDVVRPLRGRRGSLPDPLLRYGVDPGMTRGELDAHLRRVRAYWSQKASGVGNLGAVCKQLLAADEELKRTVGARLNDPTWWAEQAGERDREERAASERLAADLRAAYGATGQITRTQLETVARHEARLSAAQVEAAVSQAGLVVIDAIELPADCGLEPVAYSTLRTKLAEAGARTVVHLLHPTLTRPFTIARSFSVPGNPALTLDRQVLDRRVVEAESAADSAVTRARKSALALVRSAYAKVPDLRAIALYHIVDQLRDAQRAGLAPALLASKVIDLGVAGSDAQLLAVSLPQEAGGGVARGLARIQTLLESRQLAAARAALTALPTDHPEYPTARALVDQAQADFDRQLGEATAALGRHDVIRAGVLLRQAAELDAEDPTVLGLLERLPPPAPVQLSLTEGNAPPGVRLAWSAAPTATGVGEPSYRVVRGEDRAPVHETDGVTVAQTTQRQAVDPDVSPARPAYYAVFATVNGTVWSQPVTGCVTVVPRVGGVTVHAEIDQVTARWRAHPAAARVRVRRAVGRPPAGPQDGVPVEVSGGYLLDTGVRTGETYYYGFTAVYHDPSGREVLSKPVVASAEPRDTTVPVVDVRVDPVRSATARRIGDRLLVSWLWPEEVGLAEVRYHTLGGDEVFVISRARYEAECGCPLVAAAGGATVEIKALVVTPTGTAQSAPVRLTAAPLAARVEYTIARLPVGGDVPLRARLRHLVVDRRRLVTLTSAQRCADLEVVVVASAGVVMPVRAAQGTVLARASQVQVGPGCPHSIAVELPASLRRPYWIRCFVDSPEGCTVIDPPIEHMKVS